MIPATEHPARWWHALDDGRIQCDLCPRLCRLKEGQRAFCFVRQRVGNRMVLTTYGRSTGFCIDPIEKKPLYHFLPGSAVLSFGTAGCNLGCRFCQNWQISKCRATNALADTATPEAIAQAARANGCAAVAFTYNDPIVFAEYAIDTAEACRRAGIRTVAVTSGFISALARPEFFAPMDAANVDLKGFTAKFYDEVCLSRPGGLQDVLDTLVWLRAHTKVWLEVTTLLIPGLNDSDDEIRAEATWLRRELGPDVPLHFSAFHPDFRMLDRPPTPAATLQRARDLARACGLEFVYTGNIADEAGQSTWCPRCGDLLVERRAYDIDRYRLDATARCPRCSAPIAGVFADRPGRWGTHRRPVHIAE
ncbi:MAG: AmmeMemoRadiSam system radical SAM enzyme [Planctomycetes bacterium]|nr:AmmeMemoRadiSam system radical SAM enzyme [Planctomycetota bacterium]